MEKIQELAGGCERAFSRLALYRERKCVAPIHTMIETRNGRDYQTSFSIDDILREKVVLVVIKTENRSSIMASEK